MDNFAEVLLRQDAVRRAFANSGGLAALAALILALVSLPLGYFIVWRKLRLAKILAALVEMPYALPGVVLAIAMILVFLKPLPVLRISIYGTMWIILAAYLARFLALGLRPVVAGFQQVGVQLEEASRTCGAGFFMRLGTITAPLMGPVAAAGAILVFMTAFNELTVSALLWSAGNETLGVIVFNLDDGGLFGAGFRSGGAGGYHRVPADAPGPGPERISAFGCAALVGFLQIDIKPGWPGFARFFWVVGPFWAAPEGADFNPGYSGAWSRRG